MVCVKQKFCYWLLKSQKCDGDFDLILQNVCQLEVFFKYKIQLQKIIDLNVWSQSTKLFEQHIKCYLCCKKKTFITCVLRVIFELSKPEKSLRWQRIANKWLLAYIKAGIFYICIFKPLWGMCLGNSSQKIESLWSKT